MASLPLLAVSGIFIALKIFRLFQGKKLSAAAPSIFSLALCAGLPIAFWLIWCKIYAGDFTGSAAKIHFLGWTQKPPAEWLHHPIFTPRGFWIFLSGNLETFWQGEMWWHHKPLALPWLNGFYIIASVALGAVALFHLWPKPQRISPRQCRALGFGFAGFAAALAFFGFLSVIYDFHDCFYPSREHPYFTSGRLLLGALIPFMLIFVYGLDCSLQNFNSRAKFCVLIGLVGFMLAGEIATDWPVFSSQYNWFHM
jgi:hypothetical protein